MMSTNKAVLLDIDGTILRSHGAGQKALQQALVEVLDVSMEAAEQALARVDFRGNTDRPITDAALGYLGFAPGAHTAQLDQAYLAALDGFLAQHAPDLLPGVLELIHSLEGRPRTTVGLLTGNIRGAAAKKLAAVGLGYLAERPGGFGDDGYSRSDLSAAASRRLAPLGVRPTAILVIGDTQHDVRAAHHIGAPAVAVASGWTARAELEAAGAQLVLDDLLQWPRVVELLERL